MAYRLRNTTTTPPKGYRWIDPLTTYEVTAHSYANWVSQAIDHRVGNALPLPEESEMQEQLCLRFDEKTRKCFCDYMEGGVVVPLLGVGGTLKKMLAYAGIHSCWSCTNLAGKMDSWGPDGCEENMAEIVQTMNENANQRKWMKYLPFKELGAEGLVRLAIHKVRTREHT